MTVSFDIIIKTQKSMLFCVNIQRTLGEICGARVDIRKCKAHSMLGRSGEEAALVTGKELGWRMTGVMHQCASCQGSKAKKKAVLKQQAYIPFTVAGQQFYIDLSKTTKPVDVKHMGKQNWCMVVEEMSKVSVRNFHQTEYGMINPTCTRTSKWKAMGLLVESIRCDNSGENKKLEETING